MGCYVTIKLLNLERWGLFHGTPPPPLLEVKQEFYDIALEKNLQVRQETWPSSCLLEFRVCLITTALGRDTCAARP